MIISFYNLERAMEVSLFSCQGRYLSLVLEVPEVESDFSIKCGAVTVCITARDVREIRRLTGLAHISSPGPVAAGLLLIPEILARVVRHIDTFASLRSMGCVSVMTLCAIVRDRHILLRDVRLVETLAVEGRWEVLALCRTAQSPFNSQAYEKALQAIGEEPSRSDVWLSAIKVWPWYNADRIWRPIPREVLRDILDRYPRATYTLHPVVENQLVSDACRAQDTEILGMLYDRKMLARAPLDAWILTGHQWDIRNADVHNVVNMELLRDPELMRMLECRHGIAMTIKSKIMLPARIVEAWTDAGVITRPDPRLLSLLAADVWE